MLQALFGWRKASKCKELIKCLRCRLKLLRSKRDVIIRQLRGDVAQLLKKGLEQSAFARVEQLLKDQSILAAYDLLDHFCEFIVLNLPYIRRHRECPNDINEAVSSLIFSAARCADLPELLTLRKLFGERYGNDFAKVAVELLPGNQVNQQICEKLCIKSISDESKFRLMEEIVKEYNLQLGSPGFEDEFKLQEQQVYDPSSHNSDHGCEKEVSETDIQIVYSDDIRGTEVPDSNDKEMLQQRHFGHNILLQEKATYKPPSICETEKNQCQPKENTDTISNPIDATMVRKCTPDVVQQLNSHTSIQEVNKLNKLDPSYEIFVIYPDDAEDLHNKNDGKQRQGLISTNSPRRNKWKKPYEDKHAPDHTKIKSGVAGIQREEQGDGHVYCESSPMRAMKANLSCYHHNDCAVKFRESGDLNDGSVSSRTCHDRNPMSRRTRKSTMSRQSQLYGSCADSHELDYFLGTNRGLSGKIHQEQNCSSTSMAFSLDKLYYDESGRESDVDCFESKQRTRYSRRTEPNGDLFSQGHHHHDSTSDLADRCRRSRHLRKKLQKEMMSEHRRVPSPQPYSAWEISRDVCCEVLAASNTMQGCKYRRSRSNINGRWNSDMFSGCCLEHPCYFFAGESRIDSENSSPNQRGTVSLPDSPSYYAQLQEQEDHCYHLCRPYKCKYKCSTATSLVTKATSTRSVDSNFDIDMGRNVRDQPCEANGSAIDVITSMNQNPRRNKEVQVAPERCEDVISSRGSSPSDIPPQLSGTTRKARPPYLRAMTMPFPEQPKITHADKTQRSSSFQLELPNHHVHPKLPDYDDLAAKFTALKKEHLRSTTPRAINT